MDYILRTSFHNAQSGLQSLVYIVDDRVMLDLPHKHIIDETIDAHIKKFYDIYAAAQGLSKTSLASISFMAPIATLVRRKTDTIMEEKKYSVAYW